ncbi:MAG: DUF2683 family protein [Bacteroidota bacterium]|uniref:Uncharacterized protein n=1 Tax=Pedobacter cryotolerans TaxID=2571270 RepID=A0A4U1BY56_9SPHI|nr:DUF2683 family protein [Pedobacter cryotolerans]TKB98027.1 hypothetical protein FA045_15295 [Pedobacter cryotolerans]
MSTIIIHPETEAKEKAIKAVLEALEINFEQSEETYAQQVLAGLEKGILQANNGETKTYAEVKELLANRWS